MAFLSFAFLLFIFSSLVASGNNSTNGVIVMHYEVHQDLTVVVFPSPNTTDLGQTNDALLNGTSARRQNFCPDFCESFDRGFSYNNSVQFNRSISSFQYFISYITVKCF